MESSRRQVALGHDKVPGPPRDLLTRCRNSFSQRQPRKDASHVRMAGPDAFMRADVVYVGNFALIRAGTLSVRAQPSLQLLPAFREVRASSRPPVVLGLSIATMSAPVCCEPVRLRLQHVLSIARGHPDPGQRRLRLPLNGELISGRAGSSEALDGSLIRTLKFKSGELVAPLLPPEPTEREKGLGRHRREADGRDNLDNRRSGERCDHIGFGSHSDRVGVAHQRGGEYCCGGLSRTTERLSPTWLLATRAELCAGHDAVQGATTGAVVVDSVTDQPGARRNAPASDHRPVLVDFSDHP